MADKPVEATPRKVSLIDKKVHFGKCGTMLNDKAEPIAEWAEMNWDTITLVETNG